MLENVFVDVTDMQSWQRQLFAEHHQIEFPGNIIASFELNDRSYLKVPYPEKSEKPPGLNQAEFKTLLRQRDQALEKTA